MSGENTVNDFDDLLVYRVEVPPGVIFPEYRQQPEETTYTVDYVRHDHAHIAAFAAIRRAVEIARELDTQYKEAYLARDWDTCSLIHDGHGIRRAIRAAIGSEKA